MPYVVNSPQLMISGFKKMAAVSANDLKQSLSAQTPVLNITVQYREIEKGLFLIYSQVNFKANVCFRPATDSAAPSDFYCLSLRIDHYAKKRNSRANGVSYTDNSWLIFKPGAKVDHHHFTGTSGRYFSVYFNRKWIGNYLKQLPAKDKRSFNLFFRSDWDHLICPNLSSESVYPTARLVKLLLAGQPGRRTHLVQVKREVQGMISAFIHKMQAEGISADHFSLSNPDRIKVLKAGMILQEHMHKKFPGIGFVAKKVGLSETILKESFKTIYAKTLFRYFRDLQMHEAKKLIAETNDEIRYIAGRFGYQNAAKFAGAFKACHRLLPSQVRRNGG